MDFRGQIIICYSRSLPIGGGYPGSFFSSILSLPIFERTLAAQKEIHPILLTVKT